MLIDPITATTVSFCWDGPKKYLPTKVVDVGFVALSLYSTYMLTLNTASMCTFVATVCTAVVLPAKFLEQYRAESLIASSIVTAASFAAINLCTGAPVTLIPAILLTAVVSLFVFRGFFVLQYKDSAKQYEESARLRRITEESRLAEEKKNTSIDYAYLEQFSFTKATKEQCDRDLETGKNYSEFLKFVDLVIDGSYISVFKKGRLFPWFLSQLELLIKRKVLTDKQCEALHIKLTQASIFNKEQEAVTAKCLNNQECMVNKLALLLASPYFRSLYCGSWKDSNNDQLCLQDVSSNAVMILADFILRGQLTSNLPSDLSISVDFLHLSDLFSIKRLAKAAYSYFVIRAENRVINIRDEKGLEDFLKILPAYEKKIGQELCTKMQYDAFSSLYLKKYATAIPFYLDQDCFTIPLTALHLLKRDDAIGTYLKGHVNCIAMSRTVEEAHYTKLKLENLERFKYVAFNNESRDMLSRVVGYAPNIGTFYYCMGDDINIWLNDLVEINEKFSTKPLKVSLVNNLLSTKHCKVEIKADKNWRNMIEKIDFINFSASLILHLGVSTVYSPDRPQYLTDLMEIEEKSEAWQKELAAFFSEKYGDQYLFAFGRDNCVRLTAKPVESIIQ